MGGTVERQQVRLGFVGFGEVGWSFAKGLREEGLETIVAYDIASFDAPGSELIQGRARETRVELARTPAELAQKTEVIIAVVPGIETAKAAAAIGPHLRLESIVRRSCRGDSRRET